jgi:putative N6-adenine-specific DNA methylase
VENTLNAAALCAVGAERALSNEIRKLGLAVTDSLFGRVRFKADIAGLYRALMALRTADRVLLETAFFPAEDFDALFEGARSAPWEEFIPPGMGLRVVKVRSSRSRLSAPASIQGVVHKAAAERLCEKRGLTRLPEGGAQGEMRVYLEKDRASLLLDLSGEPLFKRGYRTEGGIAPLRETTAAAIILLAGWKRKFPLRDPFCGSGTIVIEGAMYAWDMAPSIGRRFALGELLIADGALEKAVREELLARVDFSRPMNLCGSDTDIQALKAAASNLERAYRLARGRGPEDAAGSARAPLAGQLPGLPGFLRVALEEARPVMPAPGQAAAAEGYIITNPPYGKRLGDPARSEKLYRDMGILAENFPRWKLGLICDHPGFESFFGRKADACREITNGAIPSYFYQYEEL